MGETLSSWEGLRIRGMILVGGVYDTVKQIKREEEMGMSQGALLDSVSASISFERKLIDRQSVQFQHFKESVDRQNQTLSSLGTFPLLYHSAFLFASLFLLTVTDP